MEEFSDVSRARASWKVYLEAMTAGREILRRAGVAEPPPIPEFDTIFRLLTPELRQELYAALDAHPSATPAETVQIWQPLIRGSLNRKANPARPHRM
jgi:hypothetical protein